jgi:hypothetical protein
MQMACFQGICRFATADELLQLDNQKLFHDCRSSLSFAPDFLLGPS